MADLDNLLFRDESDSLDYKRDQYKFVGCSDDTKGELLKDILAMVNSWRNETAYILVGVDDTTSPKTVVGIKPEEHIDDASLQQFVNSKTQQPVRFSYRTTQIGGHSVGVIEIPVQQRPAYLPKPFGKLQAEKVYLRRGSSTAVASIDEIAKMGVLGVALGSSDLWLEFAKADSRTKLGTSIEISSEIVELVPKERIPDFGSSAGNDPFAYMALRRTNRNYYREIMRLFEYVRFYRKIALTVTNAGAITARDIRVEFAISDRERSLDFKETHNAELPMPKKELDLYHIGADLNFPLAVNRGGCGIDIEFVDGVWHLNLVFGSLQPGRSYLPPIAFYVGSKKTQAIAMEGKIMADGLPAAATTNLLLTATSAPLEMSLEYFLTNVADNVEDVEKPGDDDDPEED